MTNTAPLSQQTLIHRAQLQTQANRYAFLRKQSEIKLVNKVASR